MATMRDICTAALRRLGVIASDETPEAADVDVVLDTASGILAQFGARDIQTGVVGVALEDEFPLEEKHRLGFTAYLAVQIAGDFGKSPTPELNRQSEMGWQLIAADYFAPEPLRADVALQSMPSQRLR